jgi:uncharacterized protein (DUF362 family)
MLNNIAIEYNPSTGYPNISPFSPSEKYPEYSLGNLSENYNSVYDQVRNVLRHLKLDAGNFDKPGWNPFGDFINPGNKIIIKPNWVREKNPVSQDISGLVTHPSVVRAVVDYCLIALRGTGEIIIGDSPIQSADIETLKSKLKLNELIDFYKGVSGTTISLRDFRKEIKKYNSAGEISEQVFLKEKESLDINLRDKSFLYPVRKNYKKFRVTNYDPRKMMRFHNEEDNIYVIDKAVLEADVVIQIPKLKTHGKAGITCCLKNSVGINCQKDALVHHTKGCKLTGGDAYPAFNLLKWINENLYDLREKTGRKCLQRIISTWIGLNDGVLKWTGADLVFEGRWFGNETLWRMILDINNILFNVNRNKEIKSNPIRKVFYIVDGITGGEKEGPLKPENKYAGIIAGGWNPVLIDISCATLIGFDYRKITVITRSLQNIFLGFGPSDLETSLVVFNGKVTGVDKLAPVVHFIPSRGWVNHIEAVNLYDEHINK